MTTWTLGRREVMRAAADALKKAGETADTYFERHARGDWGEGSEWMLGENDKTVRTGPSIHAVRSHYTLRDGTEIFICTAVDWSETKLLLAGEYESHEQNARDGYDAWAAIYDAVPNPLAAVEEPAADALLAQIPPPKTVIDIGAGTGRWSIKLAKSGAQVTAFEPSSEMLAKARQAADKEKLTIDFASASLENGLPVADNHCDLAVCALTLCHLEDLTAAVAEIARVVHPGGRLLLTDFHPAAVAWGWRTAFATPGVTHFLPNFPHSRADYLHALTLAGCDFIEVQDIALGGEHYGDTSPDAVRSRGLPPLALVILARKVIYDFSSAYRPSAL